MPKMHQNTFGGRAPPGPAGGSFSAPPDPLAAIKGFLLLREGREMVGREGEEEGREREGRGGQWRIQGNRGHAHLCWRPGN